MGESRRGGVDLDDPRAYGTVDRSDLLGRVERFGEDLAAGWAAARRAAPSFRKGGRYVSSVIAAGMGGSAIAGEMGLPKERVRGLHLAATVHDVGKIRVPAELLAKPTALNNVEFGIIRTHAQAGYEILKDIDFPWPIAQIVWQHHERLDGSGYPSALKDEQIAFEARILAVADVVEAMSSHRPYRAAVGVDKAIEEIEAGRGVRYDQAVADACIRLFRAKGFDWHARAEAA